MADRPRGMGRGLAAILTPTEGTGAAPELRKLPIELISPNPRQPRQLFDEESLLALSESVKERGVLQPVLVRPCAGGSYELIAGERRWRAAQLAGLDVLPAVIAPHEDLESLEIALIENMAREDLNPIEEARACSLLVDELGLTREEVGRRVGRSRVAVSNLLRLLDLPDEVLDLLIDGALTEGHGRALLMAPDHSDRRRLARTAVEEDWTVRETEAQARATARPPEAAPKVTRMIHPDQEEAATRLGDAFLRAFGADVKVKPRGTGYTVALSFSSLDEALELVEKVGARPRL
ncbi:ParB/RepB/Spo0J family partition protein [Solirubrobacter sp. CPCC 204708]|uniref:ParB/RepB/Spo0J family partition protein n=1 Tax=Solirubrobacter deserti TaxID=2282478 RepID=A0ABT4RMS8_9ACTN|nr:ParB/RepB/Spo0J family partition protein [Solirubrobacter deserti]MBE2316986.1 ParB/RepB/Spo0J family partition protein [Solirubrobacter deserti]MDA0139817.1 ParB/RepB/Spo0J family partition protein [Solirubrobacter deserti]